MLGGLKNCFQRLVEHIPSEDNGSTAEVVAVSIGAENGPTKVRIEAEFRVEEMSQCVLTDDVRRPADQARNEVVPGPGIFLGNVLGACFAPAHKVADLVCAPTLANHHPGVAAAMAVAVVNEHGQLCIVGDDVSILIDDVAAVIAECLPDLMPVGTVDAGLLIPRVPPASARKDGADDVPCLVAVLHDCTSFMY